MTNKGRKISKKRMRQMARKRFIFLTAMIALGVLAAIILLSLIHIGLLRVSYSEAVFNGDTGWANRFYEERLALGTGTGFMGFMYNLPSALKFITLFLSFSVLCYITFVFYTIHQEERERKRMLRKKAIRKRASVTYGYEKRRSW